MASVFDPGLLGVKTPQQCGCQELLSISNPKICGWLRRRCRRNKLHTKLKVFEWPRFYVIINDTCLYYYKRETDKKPSAAVSLYGYNRVFRSNEFKDSEVPWSFKIEHIQPEMKSFYFSASSEREMIRWMSAIKDEMLVANNMGKSTLRYPNDEGPSDESSWGSSEYNSLEGAIYHDGAAVMSRLSIVSGTSFDDGKMSDEDTKADESYECPLQVAQFDGLISSQRNSQEAVMANEVVGSGNLHSKPGKTTQDNTKTETNDSDYWAAIHFPGSKDESFSIIKSIACNGAYLVRKSEDGSLVLQVYAEDQPRKYKIFVTEDGRHTLSEANGPYFDSLEDMLYHYYNKTLPRTKDFLTVPYKLHPEYINNERH